MQEFIYAYIRIYAKKAGLLNIITQLLILDVFCQTQTLKEILDDFNVDMIDLASDVYKICHKHGLAGIRTVGSYIMFSASVDGEISAWAVLAK